MLDPIFSLLAWTIQTIFAGLFTILILKRKVGMLIAGLWIHPMLVIGACRLAKPRSVWARTHYGPANMNEAIRRHEDVDLSMFTSSSNRDDSPAAPAVLEEVPLAATTGVLLLAGVAIISAPVAGLVTGAFTGVLLPIATLAYRRIRWARTTALGLATATVVLVGLPTATGAHILPSIVCVVQLVLLGSGGYLLLRSAAGYYQRTPSKESST